MARTKPTRRNGRTPTPRSDNRIDLAAALLAKADETKAEQSKPAAAPAAPQTDVQLLEQALPASAVRVPLKRGQAQELAELQAAIDADIAHLQTLKQAMESLHRFALAGEGHDAAQFRCVAINAEAKDAPVLLFVPTKEYDEFRQRVGALAQAARQ